MNLMWTVAEIIKLFFPLSVTHRSFTDNLDTDDVPSENDKEVDSAFMTPSRSAENCPETKKSEKYSCS